jgi:radical SAM superfamily enzyme YgiQ (UPF0313 family)
MRVRLIQPSQLDEKGCPKKFRKLLFPNLTLPTIAGLTPKGADVGITIEYVDEIDFDEEVDLVGITAQTCQAPRAYQIADEFRKRGRFTIMGGTHASACQEEALEHFDSIVVGEAEDVWVGILKDVKKGRLEKRYESCEKPDLKELVIPRYDLLDFSQYVVPPLARTPLIPIQATRGCPHDCDFCSVSRFWGHRIRMKPVEHVLKEIEAVNPSRIFFSDDNMGANPKYALELFEALKPLRTRWACQLSTTTGGHPGLLEAAAAAGCHESYVGIESLKESTLDSVGKGFNKIDEYEAFFRRQADVGILAQASVIFGLDGDTVDDLERMIDRLLEWDVNYIYIAILTPFPGTKMYDRLNEQGRIFGRDWSLFDVTHVVFKPDSMAVKDLEEMTWEQYGKCYSAANIAKRLWRFKKPYVRFFPRDNALEEVFFQIHVNRLIKRRLHPFAMGMGSYEAKGRGGEESMIKEAETAGEGALP